MDSRYGGLGVERAMLQTPSSCSPEGEIQAKGNQTRKPKVRPHHCEKRNSGCQAKKKRRGSVITKPRANTKRPALLKGKGKPPRVMEDARRWRKTTGYSILDEPGTPLRIGGKKKCHERSKKHKHGHVTGERSQVIRKC